jgi:hypothetical protein
MWLRSEATNVVVVEMLESVPNEVPLRTYGAKLLSVDSVEGVMQDVGSSVGTK